MKIDVKHVADLSRISLTQEELDKFTPQMETILESVSVLKDVNTDGVQPMKAHVKLEDLREDTPETGLTQDEVLKNAKYKENGHIKIYGKVFGSIEES
ncbi:Asp-tRNA(Asn)/Glu-tRNA(Gln) amidotransferase subunit GatC [Candidatus Microgenomates bacterium]|jgi:aspartyl-tRNA(Asn)/glutamyl-tRNA(Gln) amidotransferase subunit C|nr:Asp-tRNA(Asn)/Glu-tRNA(Gln) amidotransferase subunit GatC [Candidatus Microgenomates bacterium]